MKIIKQNKTRKCQFGDYIVVRKGLRSIRIFMQERLL